MCGPGQWLGGVHECISLSFCIQLVEGLYEGDNMGGSGEVEDKARCSALDELWELEGG